MQLSTEEVELFEAACADQGNDAAQELMNLFAAKQPVEILLLIPTIPLGLLADLSSRLLTAINHEHRKRTGCDLALIGHPLPTVGERVR